MITILHCSPEKVESGDNNIPKHREACGMGRYGGKTLPETVIFSDVKSIVPLKQA